MLKCCVIIPSIRRFDHWGKYRDNFEKYGHEPDIIVIDEEDGEARAGNRALIGGDVQFFGREERKKWFKDRGLADTVIPPRSHAETSFGLLLAYERGGYDVVHFIDDDTYPGQHSDYLGVHWSALNGGCELVKSAGSWINVTGSYYPRGFPYSQRHWPKLPLYGGVDRPGEVVLNQGLWMGVPDMNAVDILAGGGMDGRCGGEVQLDGNSLVGCGNYVTVCSMNLAFRPEIIPAFYQLFMSREDLYGIDRFDDIWSGLFLKKVLDHLGKGMSYGYPLCVHDKSPRDIFRDVRAEMEGLIINEVLWKVVDEIELTEGDYLNCYRELATKLGAQSKRFHKPDYIEYMSNKMVRWTKLIEKITP